MIAGMTDAELAALEEYLRVGLNDLGASSRPPDPSPAVELLKAIEAQRSQIRASHAGNARVSCVDVPDLLTIPEAARGAGIGVTTVREWLAKGWLRPAGRRGGRLWMTTEAVAEAAARRSKG